MKEQIEKAIISDENVMVRFCGRHYNGSIVGPICKYHKGYFVESRVSSDSVGFMEASITKLDKTASGMLLIHLHD